MKLNLVTPAYFHFFWRPEYQYVPKCSGILLRNHWLGLGRLYPADSPAPLDTSPRFS